MNRALISILVAILLVLVGIGLFSCSSDDSGKPTEPTTPSGPDWPVNSLALPPADAAAMDSACGV